MGKMSVSNLSTQLNFKLRDYQEDIFNKVVLAIKSGHRQILLQLAGGGGKTKLSLSVMAELEKMGKTSIFSTPRINLAKQTFQEVSSGLGYLQGPITKGLDNKCIIANINTLINRDFKCDVVIHDEVHMNTSLNMKYEGASVRVGISATPYDAKGNPLKGWEDAHVISHPYSERWLIDKEYLTPMSYFVSSSELDSLEVVVKNSMKSDIDGESKKKVESTIVGLVDSLEKQTTKEYFRSSSTLIVAQSIKHANEIHSEFNKEGYNVGILHSQSEDKKTLEKFKRGELNVLVSVDMVSVGTDVPHLINIVLARAFGSHNLFRQTVLRGTRLYENKKEFLVFDFGSNLHRLGNPLVHPQNKKKDIQQTLKPICENCEEEGAKVFSHSSIDLEEMVVVNFFNCKHCNHKSISIKGIAYMSCDNENCKDIVLIDEATKVGNKIVGTCKHGHETIVSTVKATTLVMELTDTRKGIIKRFGDLFSLNEDLISFILFADTGKLTYLSEIVLNRVGKYSDSVLKKITDRAIDAGADYLKENANIRHLMTYVVNGMELEEARYNALLTALGEDKKHERFLGKFKNNRANLTPIKINNYIKELV